MKIFAGRSSLIGDTIMCLPLIHVLQKMYGKDIEITWPISRKCKQAAPLYLDQYGINKIYVTKDEEFLNDDEMKWINTSYDLFINPSPNHPWQQDWYNYRNCVEETMLMAGEKYLEVFYTLPEELKKPRLNPLWAKKDSESKTISIHTTAGYSKDKNRSPSFDWWSELIYELSKNFNIEQYGHPLDDEFEFEDFNFPLKRYNELSLFTQIQLASQCEFYIGTDSGFSWAMGALGVKQISLITDWLPAHRFNPLALAAVNCDGKATDLFARGGCDNIDTNLVLEALR